MARHLWTILCDRLIVEEGSGVLSLINVIERLRIPAPPALPVIVPVGWVVVSQWARSEYDRPEQAGMSFQLLAPDGSAVIDGDAELDFRMTPMARGIARLDAFPLKQFGIHHLLILSGSDRAERQEVYRFPLVVDRDDDKSDWVYLPPGSPDQP